MGNVFDAYPDSVVVSGKSYRVNLGYDRVLMAMEISNYQDMLPEDLLAAYIAIFKTEDWPKHNMVEQAKIAEAVFTLFPQTKESGLRTMDFQQDAKMIRSAFMRAYHIDLTTKKINWFQFVELLQDLPTDTALMRTIDIRQRPLPKPTKNNQEEIAELKKQKARVALKISDEERSKAFSQSIKKALKGVF